MKGRLYFISGLLLLSMMLTMPSLACGGKPSIVETDANGNVTREALVAGQFANPDIPRISVQKAYELWNSNDMPVFVDVRPKDLYDVEHIPAAKNIPNIGAKGETTPAIGDENKAAYLALSKTKEIILYCD